MDDQSEAGQNIQKRNILLVFLLVVFLVFPTIPFLLYRFGINNEMPTNKDIEVEIKPGESVKEIAENLKDAGVINSPLLFKLYLKLNGLEKNIQAGLYTIPKMSSIVTIADLVQYGRNDLEIKFIEGWRLEQLAILLAKRLESFNYQEFVEKTKNMEGYLFPDTYFFSKDATLGEVIELMSQTFGLKTAELLSTPNLAKTGLKKADVIILASLVEREIVHEDDRKIVAGILLKRLAEGLKLDVDATTQYAITPSTQCSSVKCLEEIDWWPKELTRTDLESDSPYNTRKVLGLPPMPISSFGLNALESVINYVETDYYYYLTDENGITRFARTLEEHNQNIAEYLN